jgi:autoinducer 2 (AI-2) kinase
MGHLLAIDAGTSGCRAVVFTDEGRYLAEAGRRWSQPPDPRYPGSAGFDPGAAWALIAESIRQSLTNAGIRGRDVRGVSAASVRGGLVLLDRAGRELWACGSTDARAAEQVELIRRGDPGFEAEAYARTGQTLAMSALPRLLWLRDHLPAVYRAAGSLGMIGDWILTRLGASRAVDPSNGCTTGLLDLASRSWAPELAGRWGLRTDLLPVVVEPGTVTGKVSPAAAADTGLAPGVPVVMGGGDAQCAALGLGVVRPGQAAVVGGSHWQQLVNLDRPAADERTRVRVTCHAAAGLWQAEAIALSAGAVVRWFLDAFCSTVPTGEGPGKERPGTGRPSGEGPGKATTVPSGEGPGRDGPGKAATVPGTERPGGDKPGGDDFGAMARRAEAVPAGAGGVLAIVSNAMDYGHWRHAAPSLLDLPLGDPRVARATLFRALLENAAQVTRANLETIEAATGLRPEQVAFGGGAARSQLWARILAGVLGRPVRVPEVGGATALGTAILAGVGAGAFGDAADAAAELAGGGRVYEPDPGTADAYHASFERWRAANAAQLDLAARGTTTPLWTPPGQARRRPGR